MIIGKINRRSLFVKVVIINIITIIMILLFLFYNNYYINKRIEKQKHEYSYEQFTLINNSLLTEIERLKNVSLTLAYEKNVEQMIKKSHYSIDNITDLMQIKNAIGLVKMSLPYGASFHISFNNSNVIVSDEGTYSPETFLLLLRRKYSSFSSTGHDFINISEGLHIYKEFALYCTKPNAHTSICVDIPQKAFSSYILQKASLNKDYFVVYDHQKEVLVKSEGLDQIYEQGLIDKIEKGVNHVEYGGKEYNVIKSTTKINELDMTFANIYSLDELQKIYIDSSKYTFLVALIFIIMNLFLLILHYKVYKPIMRLAGRIDKTEQSDMNDEATILNTAIDKLQEKTEHMQQVINQTRNVYIVQALYNLLRGQTEDIEPAIIEQLNNRFLNYSVVFVVFDIEKDFSKEFETGLEKHCIFEKVLIDSNSRVYIIKCTDEINVYRDIENIIEEIGAGDNCVCSISNVFEGIDNLCEAYIQSVQALYSCKAEKLVNIPICLFQSDFQNETYVISNHEEQELVNYVMRGGLKEVEKFFDDLYKKMCKVSYKNFKKTHEYLLHLLNNIMYIKNIKNVAIQVIDINTYASILKIHQYVRYKFVEFAEKCDSDTLNLYDKIVEYIENNYMNDLSVGYLADKFNITPEYLSTYFKKNSGLNLSIYINEFRIKQAIRLLKSKKNIKIADLAAEVGIENINTFTRQFKLHTGTTPAKYKETM